MVTVVVIIMADLLLLLESLVILFLCEMVLILGQLGLKMLYEIDEIGLVVMISM